MYAPDTFDEFESELAKRSATSTFVKNTKKYTLLALASMLICAFTVVLFSEFRQINVLWVNIVIALLFACMLIPFASVLLGSLIALLYRKQLGYGQRLLQVSLYVILILELLWSALFVLMMMAE